MIPFDSKKQASEFTVNDIFNNNKIHGWMCRVPDLRYGMLFIDTVNDLDAKQIIWATSKMNYPMDDTGLIKFNHNINRFEVYEKLDGTNILQYMYKDNNGNEFITYKTRLTPVLDAYKAVDFVNLWKEMIDKYPDIPTLRKRNGMNISYELYGLRNFIFTKYDTKLDTKILFGRSDDGQIIAPSALDCGNVGHASLIETIEGTSDIVEKYNNIRKFLNEKLIITKNDAEHFVEGMEGVIFYAITPEKEILYKCKPDYIMEYCREMGGKNTISAYSVYTTALNALENMFPITKEFVIELLKEDYDEFIVLRNERLIKRIVDDVNIQTRLKNLIIDEYKEQNSEDKEFNINIDKGKVMRYFATKMKVWDIDKRRAGKIYTIINDNFGR